MKIMHLSDLHLGKRLNELSLLDDQRYILDQIVDIARQHRPDCILIAGDLYDKSVPPAEAVTVLDDFLCKLCDAGFPVLVTSGNHDSAERVGFGASFMKKSRIYVSPAYGEGKIEPVVLSDGEGDVNFYLLPFLRPSAVRAAYPDAGIASYTDALRTAVDALHIDPDARNVLVAHQFAAGGETGGSEELMIGTLEKVDTAVFGAFDYVALGHIHRAQDVGSKKIRYCGTPLKYSVKEANHRKSVTFVTLGKKGELDTDTVALHPLRDLVRKKASFEELMREPASDDYIFADLTGRNVRFVAPLPEPCRDKLP